MPVFYVLDVGHGNSAILTDDNGIVVIDTGTGSKLLNFLLGKNIDAIDVLLLSHAHKDHIKGTMRLLESEDIWLKAVYLNSDSTQHGCWFFPIMAAGRETLISPRLPAGFVKACSQKSSYSQ